MVAMWVRITPSPSRRRPPNNTTRLLSISSGDDTTRGVLQFARGKPLGPEGLDWLKVHLVNLHGQLKKASLQERVAFADEHLEEIHDSADNPLTVLHTLDF
jgi:DNA-directed RNA polymerase